MFDFDDDDDMPQGLKDALKRFTDDLEKAGAKDVKVIAERPDTRRKPKSEMDALKVLMDGMQTLSKHYKFEKGQVVQYRKGVSSHIKDVATPCIFVRYQEFKMTHSPEEIGYPQAAPIYDCVVARYVECDHTDGGEVLMYPAATELLEPFETKAQKH